MTIYKYPILITDIQTVMMPVNAQILCVQVQDGSPALWAIVEPSTNNKARTIQIFGTGHPMNNRPRTYIGTIQDDGFVWHVFEQF